MKFEVYCDESSPEALASDLASNQFLIPGSLWLAAEDRVPIKDSIHCLRDKHKVCGNFVVIIRIVKEKQAEFVTCYLADTWTIQKIKKSRKWPREKDKPATDEGTSASSA